MNISDNTGGQKMLLTEGGKEGAQRMCHSQGPWAGLPWGWEPSDGSCHQGFAYWATLPQPWAKWEDQTK